jgi:hypothetical protein
MLKVNQMMVRNGSTLAPCRTFRVGRRVRIPRAGFDRLFADSYAGAAPSTAPPAFDIWSGEIPAPQV